ncbi:MAG: hypothetical protein CVV47_06145 [Spirochaetae bacterium HGW-Spirochaetae-3]|jgi:hypothetical protein|nr:MAG: hypothetical protein CVV47_06145 [Spirochaetae bacterium HGW-Spirochaetae-3]
MGEVKGRRIAFSVLAVIVVILLYFFVFAEPLSPELSAIPKWKIDIAVGPGTAFDSADSASLAFAAGDRYGYYSFDGTVAFVAEIPGGAPVSDASYLYRASAAGSAGFMLKKPDDRTIAAIDAAYPFYTSGRLFSAQNDGTGVSAYDERGRKLWTYAFPCQLSAFSAGESLVVGGTVDGWLEGISPDGGRAFSFAPGGSRLPVILGLDVSRSGNWIAAVSGIDRQRLVVLGRGGTDFRVSSHRYLESDYREPVRVIVMDDERHVLYRRPDGIGVWSVDGSVDGLLPVKADDFDAAIDEATGVAYLSARRGNKSEIVAFRLPDTLLGRISLPDNCEYIRFSGSSAFVGGRTWLARFDFVEE